MFDPVFLAGMAVLAITFATAIWIASLTGFDPTLTLVVFAALIWGLFWLLERRMRGTSTEKPTPVRIDWQNRLNPTDFVATGKTTQEDLATLGLTLDAAIGQRLLFATEHEGSNGDIYFEGDILRTDDNSIIVRATEPV